MARLLLFLLLAPCYAGAQTNLLTTNPLAEQILLGNYDPGDFASAAPVTAPGAISARGCTMATV